MLLEIIIYRLNLIANCFNQADVILRNPGVDSTQHFPSTFRRLVAHLIPASSFTCAACMPPPPYLIIDAFICLPLINHGLSRRRHTKQTAF